MATALQILHDSISFIYSHLLIINVLLSIVVVFFQRRNPKSVWAWLLILYFIPVLGFGACDRLRGQHHALPPEERRLHRHRLPGAVKRLSRRKYLAEVFSPTHMSPGKPDQNLVHACGRQLRKAFSASRTTGSPMGLPVVLLQLILISGSPRRLSQTRRRCNSG